MWEYKVVPVPAGSIEEVLNTFGELNWELVTMWFKSSSDIVAIFKRIYG